MLEYSILSHLIANGPEVALADFDVEAGVFKNGQTNSVRAPSPTLSPGKPGDKVVSEYQGSRISKEWKKYEAEETILKDNPQRWVMFPIKHQQVWEMYKQHEASFWTAEEIDLAVSRALPPRHPGTGPGTGSRAAVPRRAEAPGSSPAAGRSRRLPAACAPRPARRVPERARVRVAERRGGLGEADG